MPEPGRVLTRQEVAAMKESCGPRRAGDGDRYDALPSWRDLHALARSHEQLREIMRAYLVAVGRAPGNRDEEEVRLATAALVHAAALSAGEETP